MPRQIKNKIQLSPFSLPTEVPRLPGLTYSSEATSGNASPLRLAGGTISLPSTDSLGGSLSIRLPSRKEPWRVLIGDDDTSFLSDIKTAAAMHSQALDVKTWAAGVEGTLPFFLQANLKSGWRPDVLVLDVSLSAGGASSFEILKQVQEMAGCRALPLVLATSTPISESDRDRDEQDTPEGSKSHWQKLAFQGGADGLLWSKLGDANFLGRIGENIAFWRLSARRRAWTLLLSQVAKTVDAPKPDLDVLAQMIASFCHDELGPLAAFVRWRETDRSYRLAGHRVPSGSPAARGAENKQIDPAAVPILDAILKIEISETIEPTALRNDGISRDDAGALDYLIGRRFLGARITLGTMTYGFITLTRARESPEEPEFDTEVDEPQLGMLARLLAASLGRLETLDTMRKRQQKLLKFTAQSANSSTRTPICESIVSLLHAALHPSPNGENGEAHTDDDNGKVTCRLVNFGTGDLEPKAGAGYAKPKESSARIRYTEEKSVYAHVVREGESKRINDVRTDALFKDTSDTHTRSELCVPIKIGKHAIGALNLEHSRENFYTKLDEDFVVSAAQSVGQLIANATARRFQAAALDFAKSNVTLSRAMPEIDSDLHAVLHKLCGYSILAELKPNPNDPKSPWTALYVEMKLDLAEVKGPDDFRRQLNESMAEFWGSENTLVPRLLREKQWTQNWAYFTDDPAHFTEIEIAPNVPQRADAVLWLRKDESSPPHKAILLLWGLPPPISPAEVASMGTLAELFSSLEAYGGSVRTLQEERALGEQYEALGHVMQHFRHRLQGRTHQLHGFVDGITRSLDSGDLKEARSRTTKLGELADEIDQSYHASIGYVKKVEPSMVPVRRVLDLALADDAIAKRVQRVTVSIEFDATVECCTDEVIASMIVFSLLENALDALDRLGKAACVTPLTIRVTLQVKDDDVELRIMDNGSGISATVLAKLFTAGETTKSGGLGSALAFARVRAKHLHASLRYEPRVDVQGACFILKLPRKMFTLH